MPTLSQLQATAPTAPTVRKLDYLWSALLSIGLLAFFLLGMNYSPKRPAPTPGSKIAGIVAFESSEKQLGTPPWQRNLEAWIILRDPTLMSLPNDRYGFSNVLRLGFERPLESLPYEEVEFDHTPANEFPPRIVSMPVINPRDSVISARLREPMDLPPINEPPPEAPGVYWTLADGRPFDRLPPMDLTAMLGNGPFSVYRPTQITTIPRGSHIRVRVDLTCGNAELDQAAVDHLRKTFTTFSDIDPPTEAMRWWLSQPRSLIVHWRFADNVTNKADPLTKENWHDHGWF